MIDQTALWRGYVGNGRPSKPGRREVDNSARWADPTEFSESLRRCDMSQQTFEKAGVPLMSDGSTAYVDAGDSHTLIIGSTGSMKTRLMCMPGLEIMARAGESVVVADPKGELFDTVGSSFIGRGYDVFVVNLRDPLKGNRWNPFAMPQELYRKGDAEAARNMVMDLAFDLITVEDKTDPYWESSAQMVFYGMAWHAVKDASKDDTVTIKDVVEETISVFNDRDTRHAFFDYPECVGVKTAWALPDNTRNCIIGVFTQKLWNYVSQASVVDLLSESDVDLRSVGDRKTALFLIVPDEKITYNVLVSVFVKQLYTALIDRAHDCKDGSLPVRVNMILDEFANFPRIPGMQSMITASRSRNIRFTLVVQTEKQLRSVYGDEADAIRDNCANWVFLTGRDIRFLNELVELIGCGRDGEPLISVSRLQRLEPMTALVLAGRRDPIISDLADVGDYGFTYEKPELKEREVKKPKPKAPKKKERDFNLEHLDQFASMFGDS